MAMQHLMGRFRKLFRPRLISILCCFTIVSIAALFIYLLSERQINVERQAAEKLALTQEHLLQRQFDRSLGSMFALASMVHHTQGTLKNFDAVAADLMATYGGISRLQLAPQGIVTHSYPLFDRYPGIGENLFQNSPNRLQIPEAIASSSPIVTEPIHVEGDLVTIGYLPVFIHRDRKEEKFWGAIAIEIPMSQLVQDSQFNQIVEAGYDYALKWIDPHSGELIVLARSPQANLQNPLSYTVTVANSKLILILSSKHSGGFIAGVILEILCIIILAGLVAYLVYQLLQEPGRLKKQLELNVADLSTTHQKLTEEIIQRKITEQALQESEERFRAIADATPIPFFISRASDGLVFYGNQALCEMFGIDPDNLIGSQTPDYYYDKADRNRLVEALNTYQQLNNYELRVKTADGTVLWVAIYMRLLMFNDEPFIFAALYDITERKQADVQIRQALATEKELNQLKSYFISMTSHQFRTPLTKILGSAELLKSYSHSWTEEKKSTYFDRIEQTVQHMIEMLDDILLLTQADSEKLSFSPAPLDLVSFCETLTQQFHINDTSDPKIILTVDRHLSKSSDRPLMDRKLLDQILTNLLSNAIKYSSPETNVYFSVRYQSQTIIFTVKDQGIGIDPNEISHLFEPFHRCNNVRKIAGTGLGLTIAKKAAELHGGEIHVVSQSGIGTTFTLTIPVEIA